MPGIRLESRIRRLDVLCVFSAVLLALGGLCATQWSNTDLRFLGVVLSALGLVATYRALRRRSAWSAAIAFTLAALLSLGAFLLPRVDTGIGAAVFRSANLIFACGWTVLAVVLTIPRASPLKFALLVFAVCLSLVGVETVTRRRSVPPAQQPVAWGQNPQEILWVNEKYQPDPTLEFVRLPHARVFAYYPSDPNDYFRVVTQPDWLGPWDLRTIGGRSDPPCQMKMSLPTEPDGVLSVHVQSDVDDPSLLWKSTLGRGLYGLKGGVAYILQFRARSEPAGRIQVQILAADSSIQSNAVYLALSAEFQPYRIELMLDQDVEKGVLRIALGGRNSRIEIKEAQLSVADPSLLDRERYAVEFQMNAHGFRDIERVEEKPPGSVRLAFLGDSLTEGWGVHFEDLLTRQLESRLNEAASDTDRRFEVLNFAVSGYGSRQERLLYEKVVRRFEPDVVVVMICFNDDLSAFEEQEVLRRLQKRRDQLPLEILAFLDDSTGGRKYNYQICVDELRKLHVACKADGARLVLGLFRMSRDEQTDGLHQLLMDGFAGTDVRIFDLAEVLAEPNRDKSLFVHPLDGHPNHKAHAMTAEFLFKNLSAQGLLKSSTEATSEE